MVLANCRPAGEIVTSENVSNRVRVKMGSTRPAGELNLMLRGAMADGSCGVEMAFFGSKVCTEAEVKEVAMAGIMVIWRRRRYGGADGGGGGDGGGAHGGGEEASRDEERAAEAAAGAEKDEWEEKVAV